MRLVFGYGLILLTLGASSAAKELPEAPSSALRTNNLVTVGEAISPSMSVTLTPASTPKTEATLVDWKFLSLVIVSTGSTFADSYTTLFARQNWLAGKQGVCNMETESPYLYGTHPTVARSYAVASVKSAGSVLAAYYLRKLHSKFWSMPLVANSIISLQGVGQNMANCN